MKRCRSAILIDALELHEARALYLLGNARAEAGSGKLAMAALHYQRFLSASASMSSVALAGARAAAQQEALKVASRVAHVSIAAGAKDRRMMITLDGKLIDFSSERGD